MCSECPTIASKSINQRLLYMVLWQNECDLARERLAWLRLQEWRGKPYAKPMPGDPEPEFWPSASRKPASSGTLSLIERVKQSYRLEDIAEKHTRLRGNETLTGKCFLHDDRTPSFVIWVNEQKFKCFGCNEHGDVIDLVKQMEKKGLAWK